MGQRKVSGILSVTFAVSLGFSAQAADLKPVKITNPRNSILALVSLGGQMAGIYKKHGIALEPDIRPFAGHMAALPAKAVPCAQYAGTAAIARINKGMNLAFIAGGLTVMQEVFVKKDNPAKSIPDLKGKKFGSWSTGAGAYKAVRAAIMDAYGMDVEKDTEFVQAAAPALMALLARGDVDSMFNISSLTIRAASQPDKYRSVFAPNDYWKQKTGHAIVWSAPLVCWKDWVEEDKDRARNLSEAVTESMEWLRDPKNFEEAVGKHGKIAGITKKPEIKTYEDWMAKKKIFLTEWDETVLNSQWQFLEMAKKHGLLDKVPDQSQYGLVLD
jgi:ABC-type nitrate/sulfonate/bicarbonate transport system substrate-binding protein